MIHRCSTGGCPAWFDYFAVETRAKYGDALAALIQEHPDDLLRFEPDDLELWFPAGREDLAVDLWGTVWQGSPDSVGRNFGRPALESWSELDAYLQRVPDPRRADRFDRVTSGIDPGDGRYRLGVFWLSLFERLHMIRGMDRLFLDFSEHPDELERLLDVVHEYLLVTIDRFAACGMDGVLIGEDWGMQDRLMISPAMWRQWFKPRYAAVFERIHGHGMDAWMHSCGCIDAILGDLVDVGLDVIHPLQYGCADWESVSREYRGALSFLGCVDVCQVLTEGTADSIRRHVDRIVELFGSDRGGLVLTVGNTIMPETPLANVRALFEAMEGHRG